MLAFKIRLEAATNPAGDETITFGSSNVSSIIQEIRILSKNGCEVDRTQSANILAKIHKDYIYSLEGQKMLSMAGEGQTLETGADCSMVIPMSYISGLFRPTVKGMKIPSGLASGLRIELITAPSNRALRKTAGTGTDLRYFIIDPTMLFCCSDLNDPTQAVLMKNSAETGLEYTFPSYFSTNVSTTQTTINEQVEKAVSQCTRVFTSVYDVSGENDVTDETKDGFKSCDADILKNFQYRVGANYYPQQKINDVVEAWYVTECCWDKMRDIKSFPSNLQLADYLVQAKFAIGHGLETDDRLNLSGVPLNNSNVLELRMETENDDGISRQFEIMIEYITVARTFINQTSIKI